MTNNYNNIFDQFFGETLKKADEAVERARREKETVKIDIKEEKELMDRTFENFFGDVLRKVDSIKR